MYPSRRPLKVHVLIGYCTPTSWALDGRSLLEESQNPLALTFEPTPLAPRDSTSRGAVEQVRSARICSSAQVCKALRHPLWIDRSSRGKTGVWSTDMSWSFDFWNERIPFTCDWYFQSLFLQALSHRRPILALPSFSDQWQVAQRIENLGLGLILDRHEMTPLTVKDSVDILLHDKRLPERIFASFHVCHLNQHFAKTFFGTVPRMHEFRSRSYTYNFDSFSAKADNIADLLQSSGGTSESYKSRTFRPISFQTWARQIM